MNDPVSARREAEESVLGAILVDSEACDDVYQFLRPEHFAIEANSILYRHILALVNEGKPVDPVQLYESLRNTENDEDLTGGASFVAHLLDFVPTAANAKYHAEIVFNGFVERRVVRAANKIIDAAHRRQWTGKTLAGQAERLVAEAANVEGSDEPVRVGDTLDATMEEIRARTESDSGLVGLDTGVLQLNELTGGWEGGELTIVAARPSLGKSAFALHAALKAAQCDVPTLFVSLEMPKRQLDQRSLCYLSGVNLDVVKRGWLDDGDMDALTQAESKYRDYPIWVDDSPMRSGQGIRSMARRYRRKHDIGLVVIDYLQLVVPERDKERRDLEVGDVARQAKMAAMQLDIPVMLLSQLNRKVEYRDKQKPKLADLRESGEIEQHADIVLMLWNNPDVQEQYSNPPLTMLIPKQRNGPTGAVQLDYDKPTGRFDDWEELDGY